MVEWEVRPLVNEELEEANRLTKSPEEEKALFQKALFQTKNMNRLEIL